MEFISGLLIGVLVGAFVMILCQISADIKEKDDENE